MLILKIQSEKAYKIHGGLNEKEENFISGGGDAVVAYLHIWSTWRTEWQNNWM